MADQLKQHEDHGFFGAKQGINAMALQSGRDAAAAFSKGLVRGSIAELISIIGEREAFEWVMKQAETIIRAPNSADGGLWVPGKKD